MFTFLVFLLRNSIFLKHFFFPISNTRCHSVPSAYYAWAREWAPRLSYASVSIIFTVDYANNVPVNLNGYKSWFFCDYIQTWRWPTRKPRLLWPLCTSSLDFQFINIWIFYFCKKIIYSVYIRLFHLNSANKVEVEVDFHKTLCWPNMLK